MTRTGSPDLPHDAPPPGTDAGPGPLPVLPLEYAPPAPAAARARIWRRIAYVCLAVAWPGCVAAVGFIAAHTESVVVSGPVLFTLGVLALLGGLFTRDRVAAVVGACHCGVCVLFFVLVNVLNWGPDDAHVPFFVMGTLYTVAIAFPTAFAFTRRVEAHVPM